MECPPIEPHPSLVPFEPAAKRTLSLFGKSVQLALVPGRKARSGHIQEERPALQRSPADRILNEEAYWRHETLALTPNKFPFAKNQRILWMANPAREPDRTFWLAALHWANQSDGTALLNNIGAAATIPRAHAHLVDEQMPFLSELSERPLQTDLIDVPEDCELVCKDVPFCMIGVRGGLEGQADTLMRLADARLTATWNVIIMNDAAWIVPRGKQTAAPFFDQAIGSAEIWGRWCYVEEEQFAAATSADLEQALEIATTKPID
jgi:hypothetical protein